MTTPGMDVTRRPGRPRSAEADEAIIEATLALLARDGYDRTSIEAVAAEADVTRATVYRRYPTKAALVSAAVCSLRSPPEQPGGDVRAFVVQALEGLRSCVEQVDGVAIVCSLYLQRGEHPEMLAAFRERVSLPCRERTRAALEHARERGELRADADLELAIDLLLGSYFARALAGVPLEDDWAKRAVDAVWSGIAP